MPAANELTVIEPARRWAAINVRELWDYRELLFFLTWRDVNVRYRQTLIGAAWAVLQPLTTMVVFSLFFGRLAGISSDGVPYPLFARENAYLPDKHRILAAVDAALAG